MTLHKKDQSLFIFPHKATVVYLRPSRKTLKRKHWEFLELGIPFVTDTLQSRIGDAKRNIQDLGFQDHNLQGTFPQIAIQKWTEEKGEPAFH